MMVSNGLSDAPLRNASFLCQPLLADATWSQEVFGQDFGGCGVRQVAHDSISSVAESQFDGEAPAHVGNEHYAAVRTCDQISEHQAESGAALVGLGGERPLQFASSPGADAWTVVIQS